MTIGNRVFTKVQRALLAGVLDRIIPAEGPMPGAGELGLVEFVESVVARQASLRNLFIDGLTQIEIAANRRWTAGFGALSLDRKDSTLRDVEASNPGFFDELVRQTYNGYYTNAGIFQKLGTPEPSVQTHDNLPELLDETLLERQRQRAPFWRRV